MFFFKPKWTKVISSYLKPRSLSREIISKNNYLSLIIWKNMSNMRMILL